MKKIWQTFGLGKYREIVLAVAFFLVFDLTVLVLNFYISYQISADAIAINLAGRQRMLSQRMTKALLAAEYDGGHANSAEDALNELKNTAELFDTTLLGFKNGGMVTGGDGRPVWLAAATSAKAQQILESASSIWLPLENSINALLASGPAISTQQLDAVTHYARANNIKLLNLMNSLTTSLEHTASAKADRLRKVQTAGIVLALMNFAFILFKFIRRLRDNDRKIEQAQKETAEILGTVKEGLFLLDADFRFGSQYSASLPMILGVNILAGGDFRALLHDMVPPRVFAATCDYITLLFGDRVKESLVLDLNPLSAVEVSLPTPNGPPARRFLTLQFNRVLQGGKISHLLVTVFDVTAQIDLERALADARRKNRTDIGAVLDILRVDPATLNQFLTDAERTILEVNDQLRSVNGGPGDYRRTIGNIFRQIHALKGEAATLDLGMFEDLAQQFESLLAGLRDKGTVSGDDLLALPLPLDELLESVTAVRDLNARLASYHDAFSPKDNDASLADDIARLAQRIARDHGKEVQVGSELEELDRLPAGIRSKIRNIAVQLVRNAVVHGIEPAGERLSRAKSPAGSIYLALKSTNMGDYEFLVRDDGRGLIPERIRSVLLRSGRYTETQLRELDDKQVIMKIFEPGFTTAERAGRDAGHGVGLDVVRQKIQQIGARLQISTRNNAFTQFSIRFTA